MFSSIERWVPRQLLETQEGCRTLADGTVKVDFRLLSVTQARAGGLSSRMTSVFSEARPNLKVSHRLRRTRPRRHLCHDRLGDFTLTFTFVERKEKR